MFRVAKTTFDKSFSATSTVQNGGVVFAAVLGFLAVSVTIIDSPAEMPASETSISTSPVASSAARRDHRIWAEENANQNIVASGSNIRRDLLVAHFDEMAFTTSGVVASTGGIGRVRY